MKIDTLSGFVHEFLVDIPEDEDFRSESLRSIIRHVREVVWGFIEDGNVLSGPILRQVKSVERSIDKILGVGIGFKTESSIEELEIGGLKSSTFHLYTQVFKVVSELLTVAVRAGMSVPENIPYLGSAENLERGLQLKQPRTQAQFLSLADELFGKRGEAGKRRGGYVGRLKTRMELVEFLLKTDLSDTSLASHIEMREVE